ncbi:1-phosphatidylinositol 4,5-bisphosphate phosphodiesterase delta-1 [Planoprotostelium fungivorum]|uniref:Phosphoinositide phospholipase C n=1 Tax=Planoprotostelium fungivorum TaxID=1890364 RepID=A0A2P6NJR6_9EUKA|nr:1-phosphatidylinositol 4,5-bisphosphate phosphodiesterase delta-1 [Planoprotostelium fungivorum]
MTSQVNEEHLKSEWSVADKDGDGTLTMKEIVSLLDKMNIKLKSKVVQKKFEEVDKDKSGKLDYNEFKVSDPHSNMSNLTSKQMFVSNLQLRNDIETLFEELNKGKNTGQMDEQQFYGFLKDVQKDKDASPEKAKALIQRYEPGSSHLTSKGFASYIADLNENSAMEPSAARVYQDMTQPLHHYYIASSHNTYLLQDQLRGPSSVEAYKNALLRGCRCVELDCWDGPQAEPIVYHGHTLTSRIKFEDVLTTIKEHGFTTSPYPVILSLEVHCSVQGQKNMAALLHQVLGSQLLPEKKMFADKASTRFKSPEELKNKIIVKGKTKAFQDEGAEIPRDEIKKLDPKEGQAAAAPAHGEKIAAELSDLVHLKATGFTDWNTYKDKFKYYYMSSFSEEKIDLFAKKNGADFIEYNRRHLSRIFPKGSRVDSSNYDPVKAWNHGSSIVALNYQTGSVPMFLNDGKFLENGKAGYVLKPQYFTAKDDSYHPGNKGGSATEYEITLISGWQLPKTASSNKRTGEIIDSYVKVEVRGIASDDFKTKTHTVSKNGFNPQWNHHFKFTVTRPELAVLLFVVKDKDLLSKDDLIGVYSQPIACLREGIRSVPIKGKHGQPTEGSMLMKIKINRK